MQERMEREEKERKKNELKLLRKREKEREKEREAEKERQLILAQMASAWRTKNLLKRYFEVLKGGVGDRRIKAFLAEKTYQKKVLKQCLDVWVEFKNESRKERTGKADELFFANLKSKCFKSWLQYSSVTLSKYQAACDLYEFKLSIKTFESWRKYTEQTLIRETKLTRTSGVYYKYKLMRRYFEGWCKFIREKDAIKTREEIRKRLESKVVTEICGYLPSSMREIC